MAQTPNNSPQKIKMNLLQLASKNSKAEECEILPSPIPSVQDKLRVSSIERETSSLFNLPEVEKESFNSIEEYIIE